MYSSGNVTLDHAQLINMFERPAVRVLNTLRNLFYKQVSFRLFKWIEIRTFSIVFPKHGWIADNLLILLLPYFRSFWLSTISVFSISPDCWSHWSPSEGVLSPITLRLLMNVHNVSCIMWTAHGMYHLITTNRILKGWRVDWCSQVIN
jgi:hypothetical protein